MAKTSSTPKTTPKKTLTMRMKAAPSTKEKKPAPLFVVKIKHLPFGFFEQQLIEYFTQFGRIVRARVARSTKTGNHKGWAFVGFTDKDVAEVAAETMNGYLMFEKRLVCKVMDPKTVPAHMLSGPRILPRPAHLGRTKKEAIKLNAEKTTKQVDDSKKRRAEQREASKSKLLAMGIDYDLGSGAPSRPAYKTAANPVDNDATATTTSSLSTRPRRNVTAKK